MGLIKRIEATTGGTNLISCQNVTSSNLDFCCDHTNGCCDSGIARFQVADNVDVITLGASGALSSVVDSMSSSQTKTAAASTTSTKESSTATSSTTTALTVTTSSSALPTTSLGPMALGLSRGAQAGIGIGCGIVGLVSIIGGVYVLLMRKKKGRAAELDRNRKGVPGTGIGKEGTVEIEGGIPVSELEDDDRNGTGEVSDYYAAQKRGLLRGRESRQAVEVPSANGRAELL